MFSLVGGNQYAGEVTLCSRTRVVGLVPWRNRSEDRVALGILIVTFINGTQFSKF